MESPFTYDFKSESGRKRACDAYAAAMCSLPSDSAATLVSLLALQAKHAGYQFKLAGDDQYELQGDITKPCYQLVPESIITEPDGSRSVLVSFRGERCHAQIVDKLPDDGTWNHTGYTSMGYDIYHKRSSHFDPYDFVAIKDKDAIKEGVMARDKTIEVRPGDKITVGKDTATVGDVLFQDVFLGDDYIMATADVEFKDDKGNYRHWQSWSDGGKLTTKSGEEYEFMKESKEAEHFDERDVRKNFAKYLEKVPYGWDLSCVLEYGFSDIDISNLAKLYRDGKFRKKIEELLTDCNFHQEVEDFENGNFDPYIIEGNVIESAINDILNGVPVLEAVGLMESTEDYDKITALLQFLGWDDTEDNRNRISVAHYNANVFSVDDRNDFLICDDDEADEEIDNLIDDLGLDAFSNPSYILENFIDEDPINEYYQDDVESYARDIENEEDPITIKVYNEDDELVDVEVTNRLFKECIENNIIDESDFTTDDFDEDGEYIGDKDLVELYCDHFQTPEDQGYENGYDWLRFNFGKEFASKFIMDHDALDVDAVAEYIKSEDGRGGELNSWDGEEYEEEVNGTTYYIYPNCDFEELKEDESDE